MDFTGRTEIERTCETCGDVIYIGDQVRNGECEICAPSEDSQE